jgi:hypothetical protein
MTNLKKAVVILVGIVLTGCADLIVPPGYYQPHVYNGNPITDTNKLSTLYASCKDNVSVYSVDNIEVRSGWGAHKLYIKPGERRLKIVAKVGSQRSKYIGHSTVKYEFEAGRNYLMSAHWGEYKGGFLEGHKREYKIEIKDMGEKYTPRKSVYVDQEHQNRLVIKSPKIPVNITDCIGIPEGPLVLPMHKNAVRPEYKKIFIEMGLDYWSPN